MDCVISLKWNESQFFLWHSSCLQVLWSTAYKLPTWQVTCHRHLGNDCESHLQGLSTLWVNCSCYNESPLYAGLHVIASVLRLPLHPAELSNRLFSSHHWGSQKTHCSETQLWFFKKQEGTISCLPCKSILNLLQQTLWKEGQHPPLTRQQLAFSWIFGVPLNPSRRPSLKFHCQTLEFMWNVNYTSFSTMLRVKSSFFIFLLRDLITFIPITTP